MVISLQVTCCTRIAGAFTTFILRGTGFMNSTLTNHISKYVYVHFDKHGILGFCNTLVCVQVVLYCWGGRGGGTKGGADDLYVLDMFPGHPRSNRSLPWSRHTALTATQRSESSPSDSCSPGLSNKKGTICVLK